MYRPVVLTIHTEILSCFFRTLLQSLRKLITNLRVLNFLQDPFMTESAEQMIWKHRFKPAPFLRLMKILMKKKICFKNFERKSLNLLNLSNLQKKTSLPQLFCYLKKVDFSYIRFCIKKKSVFKTPFLTKIHRSTNLYTST